jgi:hypothetical protein
MINMWNTPADNDNSQLDGVRIMGKKAVELMSTNNLPPAVGNLGADHCE